MRPLLLRLVTYGAPIFVGACFFAATQLPRLVREDARMMVLWACAALAALATAAGSFLLATRFALPRQAARMALAPTMLVLSAYGAFLLVERDLTRIAIAAIAVGLFAAHSAFVAGMKGEGARYVAEDLRHLVFALRVVACFFAFAFAFSLPVFSRVHPVAAAALVAALVAFVAWETLHDEGFTSRPPALVAAAFAALGAEFYAGLTALPVSALTSAAVGLILFVTALLAATIALKGAAPPRRNVVLASALVVLVLATARWN